ncbi:MAG: extracellular solute-binding protein [bacterium]|nr:extracellular solute-binding protein [bacterium]
MKRIWSFLLALALLLSCTSVSFAEERVEELTLPLTEEPITLSFLLPFNSSNGLISSFDEMGLFQEMEKRTNINIDHLIAGDCVTEFNLMCASGDLPDMAFLKAIELPGGVASYVEDGMIIGLNDLIEQYAPNIRRMFEEHPEWKEKMSLEDGTIYAIPKIKRDPILLNTQGLQVRSDWLERVGLEVPTTIDEWTAVLKAFKEQDANGNGDVNDEIPFSGIAFSALGQERSFVGMFALGFGTSDTFYQIDNKVSFGPYDEKFYDVLKTLNSWYEAGYIDPDYLSNDADVLGAKATNNQVGSTAHHLNHGMAKFLAAWQSAGHPEYSIVGAPYPVAPDGTIYSNVAISQVGVVSLVVTSANKHPKETVQWFDYLFSDEGLLLYNYGVEGESYTMVDGEPQYTAEITNNPQGLAASSALYKYNMGLGDFPGMQIDAVFTKTTRWPQQVAAYETFSSSKAMNLLNINHNSEESETIGEYWGDIQTYCIESINKFIMGIEPLNEETFAAYRETLKDLHIEELIEIKQAAYDRSI